VQEAQTVAPEPGMVVAAPPGSSRETAPAMAAAPHLAQPGLQDIRKNRDQNATKDGNGGGVMLAKGGVDDANQDTSGAAGVLGGGAGGATRLDNNLSGPFGGGPPKAPALRNPLPAPSDTEREASAGGVVHAVVQGWVKDGASMGTGMGIRMGQVSAQELGIEDAGHKLQSLVGSAAAAAQAAGQEAAPPQQPQTRPRDRTLLMEQLRSVDKDYELEDVDDTGQFDAIAKQFSQFDAIAKQVSFISFLLIAAVIPTTTTRSP
jgi:hypothetical protein